MELPLKTLTAAGALALLWAGESWLPLSLERPRRPRLGHDALNLAVGIGNSLLLTLGLGSIFAGLDAWAESRGIGLLRWASLPPWLETVLALLCLDVVMYLWHRLSHVVPWLWRFHRFHHVDRELDATTGLRFHTVEVLLGAVARLALLPALGIGLWQLVLYEAIFLPIVLLQHADLRLPCRLERALSALVVTPRLHRVHHGQRPEEHQRNFASVLPLWDHLLGSYRSGEGAERLVVGLAEGPGAES